MNAFKCDRCKKFRDGVATLNLLVETNKTGKYINTEWELCKDCTSEFLSFVANHHTEATTK